MADHQQLDNDLLEEIESFSAGISREAGQILMEKFGLPIEVDYKGSDESDPVTEADRASEEYLRKAISSRFPQHNILGEENGVVGSSDSPFLWVLDPLDGTANFINKFPFFAVSVGVLYQGQPVAGSIFVSESHKAGSAVYHAGLDRGAWCDDTKIEIAPSPSKRPLAEMPVGASGINLKSKTTENGFENRNLGSIAVEIAFTAAGIFRVAYFHGPKIWDVAAGLLLVKEAGGMTCVRSEGKKNWSLFTEFRTGTAGVSAEELKKWSLPVVTGAADTVGDLAEPDKKPVTPLSRLKRVFG